jgi:hypothetical protein
MLIIAIEYWEVREKAIEKNYIPRFSSASPTPSTSPQLLLASYPRAMQH